MEEAETGDSGTGEQEDVIPERRQSVVRADVTGRTSSAVGETAQDDFVDLVDYKTNPSDELERKRGYVLEEFISSEETYYRRLQLTFDLYVQPLRKLEILTSAEINVQFFCWDLLVGLHKDLWENMVADRDAGKLNIGARFKLFSHFLKCYSQYLANFDRARLERARLLTSNKKFAAFVERVEADAQSQYLPLESFLMEPVQRVPRYRLLLEQLLKYTPEGHAQRADTTEALAQTADVAQQNCDAIVTRDNKDKIMAIMMSLSPATRINLLDDPSREFLKEAVLQRQCRRGVKEFQFWLFSDKILYGNSVPGLRGTTYSLNRDISLTACRVRSVKKSLTESSDDVNRSTDAESDAAADLDDSYSSQSFKHSSLNSLLSTTSDSYSSKGSTPRSGRKSSLGSIKETIFLLHQQQYPMSGSETQDPLPDTRAFIVESPQKSFQVWASTEGEKMEWMAAINGAIAALRRKHGEEGEEIAPLWIPDTAVANCQQCQTKFGLINRRHHCRNCGCNVCDGCSKNRCTLSHVDSTKDVRVCNTCFLDIAAAKSAEEETAKKQWTPDKSRNSCLRCTKEFTLLNRRHHCRNCGSLCCGNCTSKKAVLKHVDEATPMRVCDICYWNLGLA